MAVQPFRSRRTALPDEFTLAEDGPTRDGLLRLWNFASDSSDAAGLGGGWVTGDLPFRPGGLGGALHVNAARAATSDVLTGKIADQLTVLVAAQRIGPNTNSTNLFGEYDNTDVTTGAWGFYLDGSSNLYWDITNTSSSGAFIQDTAWTDNAPHVYMGMVGGGTIRLIRDGVLVGTQAFNGNIRQLGAPVNMAGYKGASEGFPLPNFLMFCAAVWNTDLGTQRAIELTRDPAQLFRSEKGYRYINGVLVPTLSLPTAKQITSSSFIPGLTLTF